MTRKHFKMIAEVVLMIENETDRWATTHNFAKHLAAFNPNFNRERFLAACGV